MGMAQLIRGVESDVAHLLPGSREYAVRVGQLRAVIEEKVHMARIGADVAKSSALATGQFENDHFRVDRVEDLLSFRRFCQNQFAQRQRKVHHSGRTLRQEIEELRARFAYRFHTSKVIWSPG